MRVVIDMQGVQTESRFRDIGRYTMSLAQAIERAGLWWNAAEVVQVFPTAESTLLFLGWLEEHKLGRKRLLDTMLASTLRAAGVTSVLTLNREDFSLFGGFTFPE